MGKVINSVDPWSLQTTYEITFVVVHPLHNLRRHGVTERKDVMRVKWGEKMVPLETWGKITTTTYMVPTLSVIRLCSFDKYLVAKPKSIILISDALCSGVANMIFSNFTVAPKHTHTPRKWNSKKTIQQQNQSWETSHFTLQQSFRLIFGMNKQLSW